MTWINPLDKLPQIRQDYANHICYGGFMGLALIIIGFNPLCALLISLLVSGAKKVVDYYKETESFKMCFVKTFVTVFFPFVFFLNALPDGSLLNTNLIAKIAHSSHI